MECILRSYFVFSDKILSLSSRCFILLRDVRNGYLHGYLISSLYPLILAHLISNSTLYSLPIPSTPTPRSNLITLLKLHTGTRPPSQLLPAKFLKIPFPALQFVLPRNPNIRRRLHLFPLDLNLHISSFIFLSSAWKVMGGTSPSKASRRRTSAGVKFWTSVPRTDDPGRGITPG
jgi:hypothetical protein